MSDRRQEPLDPGTLVPGDRIRHPQLGTAVVRATAGGVVTARFDDGEVRQFLASHPGVQRLDAFAEGRISPPWGEIDDPERFLPAQTPGDPQLARYLDDVLPRDWRIYVRPHLDADRPLLAALHRTAGGMFWDVVDWDLSTFQVEDGLWMSAGRRFASPDRFMNEVRSRVYGVYVPEMGEALNGDNHVFSVISAALYFPRASTAQAAQLAAGDPAARWIETLGSDALDPRTPRRVAPVLGRHDRLRNGWFEGLDAALTHARRMPDALSVTRLTPDQQRRAASRPGYTAVEGVAGSGKTLILAHRAAAAAADGRRALLLTYNRTLTNFIRALLQHTPYAFRSDRLTVLHFHELCRRIHDHHDEPLPSIRRRGRSRVVPNGPPLEDLDPQALEVDWPESARKLLTARGVPAALRFDLVLIDEGQDFGPEWLGLIGQLGASEVVMAHDLGQRLYDREDGLSSKGIANLFGISKTRGAPMRKVIRLPAATVRLASDYAERWSIATASLEVADDGLLPPDATITGLPAETPPAAAAGAVALLDAWRQATDSLRVTSRLSSPR